MADFLFDFPELAPDLRNEWWTPRSYIEAARAVMGSIDLDPASCAEANRIVSATRFYTQRDNGLAQQWWGRIWLNPPYGKTAGISRQQLWIGKLTHCYRMGQIEQAILLSTADTDEKWFQPLWEFPICFANHHLYFHRPGQTHEKQMFGTAFTYLGPHRDRFIERFSPFGPVIQWDGHTQPKGPTQAPMEWGE